MSGLVVLLLLAAVGAGAWAWQRSRRRGNTSAPRVGIVRATPAPRFTGRVASPLPRPPQPRAVVARNRAPARPAGRFSGSARIPPNAIGLACGTPVAECKRNRDCLCIP